MATQTIPLPDGSTIETYRMEHSGAELDDAVDTLGVHVGQIGSGTAAGHVKLYDGTGGSAGVGGSYAATPLAVATVMAAAKAAVQPEDIKAYTVTGDAVTVAAGAAVGTTLTVPTVTGYTLVSADASFMTSGRDSGIAYLYGGTVYLRNFGTAAVSPKPVLRCLYVKTAMLGTVTG